MQFVPTPVLLVALAILLCAAIALLRQIRQHIRQFHAALPRDTGFRLRDVGTLSSWVAGVRPRRAPRLRGSRSRLVAFRAFCDAVTGYRSRASMAVESRAM